MPSLFAGATQYAVQVSFCFRGTPSPPIFPLFSLDARHFPMFLRRRLQGLWPGGPANCFQSKSFSKFLLPKYENKDINPLMMSEVEAISEIPDIQVGAIIIF